MKRFRNITAIITILFICTASLAVAGDFSETWLEWFGDDISPYAGSTAFPLLDIAVGGRFEAMSGAYAAVGGDIGSLESNPAGTAYVSAPSLSFFHHEWIADSAIESAAFVTSFGPIGLGAAIKYFRIPFTAYDNAGERENSGDISEFIGTVNASVRFINFESFSLAAGVNFKAALRNVPERIATEQSGFALPFDLGLLMDLLLLNLSKSGERNFSVGFTMRNIGPNVEFLDAPLPTALSAGMAYRPFDFLLVSGEATIPIDLQNLLFLWDDFSYAVGASVQFAAFLGIHIGARIKTGNPQFAIGTTVHFDKISIDAAYSVDLAQGLEPLASMSLGATLYLGSDKLPAEAP